jgi:hypothetical protein
MSAQSEEVERQIKAWRESALSAATDAMDALYQCYLTRAYCSQLKKTLLRQRLQMEKQRKRLNKETVPAEILSITD